MNNPEIMIYLTSGMTRIEIFGLILIFLFLIWVMKDREIQVANLWEEKRNL